MTGTLTQTGTPTQTWTQTTTSSVSPRVVAQSQPEQQPTAPNIGYVAIGSIMGCLVLMTVVVVAILVNNKQKKPMSYSPTMMTVPTHAFDNPSFLPPPPPPPPSSNRTLYPPMPPRD
jgi:hypothetical protein